MEVQKLGQSIVSEHVLNPLGEITFEGVNPIGPMAGSNFHRFVESVGDGFPAYDDDITQGMQIVALFVNFFGPGAPWDTIFPLGTGEEPTDDGRKEQNHAHHDAIGFHDSGAASMVL